MSNRNNKQLFVDNLHNENYEDVNEARSHHSNVQQESPLPYKVTSMKLLREEETDEPFSSAPKKVPSENIKVPARSCYRSTRTKRTSCRERSYLDIEQHIHNVIESQCRPAMMDELVDYENGIYMMGDDNTFRLEDNGLSDLTSIPESLESEIYCKQSHSLESHAQSDSSFDESFETTESNTSFSFSHGGEKEKPKRSKSFWFRQIDHSLCSSSDDIASESSDLTMGRKQEYNDDYLPIDERERLAFRNVASLKSSKQSYGFGGLAKELSDNPNMLSIVSRRTASSARLLKVQSPSSPSDNEAAPEANRIREEGGPSDIAASSNSAVDFRIDANWKWADWDFKLDKFKDKQGQEFDALSRITGTTAMRQKRETRDKRKEAMTNLKKNVGLSKLAGWKGKAQDILAVDANLDVLDYDIKQVDRKQGDRRIADQAPNDKEVDPRGPVHGYSSRNSNHDDSSAIDTYRVNQDSSIFSRQGDSTVLGSQFNQIDTRDAIVQAIFENRNHSLYDGQHEDGDDQRGVKVSSQRQKILKIMNSWFFEVLTWIMIIVNAILHNILIDTRTGDPNNHDHQKLEAILVVLTELYVVFFALEMMVRVAVGGSNFWRDAYNVQDLVVLFIIISLYTTSVMSHTVTSSEVEMNAWLSLSVLRLLRVLRIVDWVRFKPFFHELYIMVRGLSSSIKVLLWGVILGMLILYVFAVFIATFVGNGAMFQHQLYEGWFLDLYGVDTSLYAKDMFGTVSVSILSLFRIMTLDNWSELVDPLTIRSSFLMLFFIVFIVFTVFAFLNLVTAVIVESSTQLQKEEDNRLERLFVRKMKELERMIADIIGKKKRVKPHEMVNVYIDNPPVQKVMKVFGIMDEEDLTGLLTMIVDPRNMDAKVRIKDILLAMTRYSNQNAKSRDVLELLAIARRTNHEIYWSSKRITKMHREMKYVLAARLAAPKGGSMYEKSAGQNSKVMDKTMTRDTLIESHGHIFPVDLTSSKQYNSKDEIEKKSKSSYKLRAAALLKNPYVAQKGSS